MKEFSGKKGKRALPLAIGLVLFLGCLLFLAPSQRGPFFNEREATGREVPRHSIFEPGKDGPGRYKIMDRGYREIAVSFMTNSLYARPLEIDDLNGTSTYLAANLGLDEKSLIRDLKAERGFVWLGRRLPESSSDAILKKSLKGVHVVKEAQRYYPGGSIGAHVVGFVEEENGLAGVESFYDGILGGGFGLKNNGKNRQRGHLLLTIDLQIQNMLEENLASLQLETGAVSAAGLLMNAKDGSILAMGSLPGFDPNRYWESSKDERLNRTINTFVETAPLKYLLSFADEYDRLASVEHDSLAVVKRGLQLSEISALKPDRHWFSEVDGRYLSPELITWPVEMGNGIPSPAELSGRIGMYDQSIIDLPDAELISSEREGKTTPLQMLTAITSLVNGGRKVSPRLGLSILDPKSGELEGIDHPDSEIVIRSGTSEQIVEILEATSLSPAGTLIAESLELIEPEYEKAGPAAEDAEDGPVKTDPSRYRTMLISFTTLKEPGLAMFITLEQATVASGEKTPMRVVGEEMMQRAQELAGRKIEYPGLQSLALREAQNYDNWLKSRIVRKDPVIVASVGERQNVMPDLKNLSVRKALRILDPFGLKVKVVGSGRIVAQLPQPGLNIGKGECVLTLQSDN